MQDKSLRVQRHCDQSRALARQRKIVYYELSESIRLLQRRRFVASAFGASIEEGIIAMNESAKALKAAGCPDQHCEKLAVLGFTPAQVQDLNAKGIDWQKFLQNLPALIAMIMSLFGNQPTPAPVTP